VIPQRGAGASHPWRDGFNPQGSVAWGLCPLLGLEVVLPCQVVPTAQARPEIRLLAAILEDAMACATQRIPSLDSVKARQWLADGADDAWGSGWVCLHLGVDLGKIQRAAHRLVGYRPQHRFAGGPDSMRVRGRGIGLA
jgi:hypothetical protein